MKTLNNQTSKVIFNSREIVKTTPEYQQKVGIIRDKINLKYQVVIKNERNPIKKFFLIIKKKIELKRAIEQLTSLDKMYLTVK
ncbi:hypothetical protein [Adhaeribacter rhizoryzae]|uniref:Uncharacterized protein n=1 Tax=Adhaeribacter rhizoryzae TaxID=2607907 RepID=A0A5M6D6X0_9BACT|nr:hypothetical protein [Adhaeribacter rhizoryzae]KAA5543297.1 hypothetical protein F0145_16755 [Adhaeribacter rhizoryzae]